MFIEPTITWVPSGFSGYIWLDTKTVLKKLTMQGETDHDETCHGRTDLGETDCDEVTMVKPTLIN